jgi:hypothetical protein
LVTASGDSKRELYTTDSEYAFKVKHPVIVNGINVPSDRAVLLSRFVSIEVPAIRAEERISEAEFSGSRGVLPTSAEALRSDPLASGKKPQAFLLSDLGVDRYARICIPSVRARVLHSHLPPGIRTRTPYAPREASKNLIKP